MTRFAYARYFVAKHRFVERSEVLLPFQEAGIAGNASGRIATMLTMPHPLESPGEGRQRVVAFKVA